MKTLSEQISDFFSSIVTGRFSQLNGWGAVQISIYDIKIYHMQKNDHVTYALIDNYLLWLSKEVDDETAMKYIQKPSPDLPDDTVIAIFYTNVWNKLLGRKQWEEKIRKPFVHGKYGRKSPLCITMAICRGYANESDVVEYVNGFLKLLVKRVADKSLIEIVREADISLPDETVLVKIYGDIWKDGPLFREYPDR